MTTFRPRLKLRPGRRRKYDALHTALYEAVEADRALRRQYEAELNLVPESRFDGRQVTLFERIVEGQSKQERRAARSQRIFQTGSAD